MQIEAIIFDMDGVLVNSEPLWRQAMEIEFARVGVELTSERCAETMGFRIDEVVKIWHARTPWEGPSCEAVSDRIVRKVGKLISEKGQLMAGVAKILNHFKMLGLPMAIASSSHLCLIETVVDTLNIRSHFDLLYSAEFETHGKPHPAVFIGTANKIGVAPRKCLVFEDSLHGVIAAKAAGMQVIAIPEPEKREERGFAIAEVQLNSMEEVNAELLSRWRFQHG